MGEFSSDLESEGNSGDRKAGNFNCEEEATALKREMNLYLAKKPKYSMKRLLQGDLKHLYSQQEQTLEDISQYKHEPLRWLLDQSAQTVPNPKKGGFRILNLNFNW